MANRKDDVIFMDFNQDASCVSIGTQGGYRIFNCQPFGRNIFSPDGGIGIVEMLFCTSLVALVGGGEKPAFPETQLKLWNTKTASMICELDFDDEKIRVVKLNRKRLVVVLETKFHVYDLDTMVNLQTLEIPTASKLQKQSTSNSDNRNRSMENSQNSMWQALTKRGNSSSSSSDTRDGAGARRTTRFMSSPVVALSPDDTNSFLAFSVGGDVFLYDTLNLVEFQWINAHKSPLTALRFSLDGTMLATASETGTVIRVFRVPSGEKIYSFRRGSTSAAIYSLAFDEVGSMLAASSSTGTVHIFRLNQTHGSRRSSIESNGETPTVAENGSGVGMREFDGNNQAGGERNDGVEQSKSFFGMAASNARAMLEKRRALAGRLLPESISDIVEPSRNFAFAKLKENSVVSVCAIAKGLVSIVTSEGHFFQYAVSKGECQLVFEMSLHVSDAGKEEELGSYSRFFKLATDSEESGATSLTNDGETAAEPDLRQSAAADPPPKPIKAEAAS